MYLHEQMEDMGGSVPENLRSDSRKMFPHSQTDQIWIYHINCPGSLFSAEVQRRSARFRLMNSTILILRIAEVTFHAAKPLSKRGWDCMHSSSNLLAGYPHIYYYGNPQIPRAFLMKCLEYHNKEF